jgi:hypothetical protein
VTAAEDLRSAADVLRRDSWGQNCYCNLLNGAHDLSGALACAASDGRTSLPGLLDMVGGEWTRFHAAARFVHTVTGAAWLDAWNDVAGRELAEVLAALESAAVLADGVPA